jgi:hypothetical protein
LIRRSVLGKVDFKCVGIGKELDAKTLWLFENETQIGCVTISFGLIVRENTKGSLAATFSAWVSFGCKEKKVRTPSFLEYSMHTDLHSTYHNS